MKTHLEKENGAVIRHPRLSKKVFLLLSGGVPYSLLDICFVLPKDSGIKDA